MESDDPADDSELGMRGIVPRAGETAETDKLIVPMRVRRRGGVLLDVLLELSDETVLIVALRLSGVNSST